MQYFYDLSLLDVRGELSSALTILHYGNELGAFSEANQKMVNLDRAYVIEIDVTVYASNDDGVHSYALVFFEKNWKEEVWKEKLLESRHNLKSVTTRVTLTADMTENPKQEHHLFTASNRYIDFVRYPDVAFSSIVPAAYVNKFNERFVGYLMRSERSFDDVHAMLDKYQLSDMVNLDYRVDPLHEQVKVSAYGVARKSASA